MFFAKNGHFSQKTPFLGFFGHFRAIFGTPPGPPPGPPQGVQILSSLTEGKQRGWPSQVFWPSRPSHHGNFFWPSHRGKGHGLPTTDHHPRILVADGGFGRIYADYSLLIRRFKAHIMHSYTMLISIAALCAGVDGIDFSVYAAMQHNAS